MSAAITIRKLSPELEPDYLAFFDRDAFPDNPDWAPCYCNFYFVGSTGKPWDERTAEENRADVSQRIRLGKMPGYLAYLEDRPVGWCLAAPKMELPTITMEEAFSTSDLEHTGAIVCFIVAGPYRRIGIAQRLFEAACESLREAGMRFLEAYPRTMAHDDAENCRGPLGMYRDAGFEVVREVGRLVVVRKRIG